MDTKTTAESVDARGASCERDGAFAAAVVKVEAALADLEEQAWQGLTATEAAVVEVIRAAAAPARRVWR